MATIADVRALIKRADLWADIFNHTDAEKWAHLGEAVEKLLQPGRRGRPAADVEEDLAMAEQLLKVRNDKTRPRLERSRSDEGSFAVVAELFGLKDGRSVRRRLEKRLKSMFD
ncbi:hypothetical protein [Rhodanobacter sp. L36]|uniref:hypothetical protein n=1 Tax=Rhodanobacter sp. L36 TaxID=1747221 RepID=UPI00131A7F55|nr:hypothetical protein [Rhodanobacter sp. L36]